jgi:hypothetical protein
MRPLWRHYVRQETHLFYLHSCFETLTPEERLKQTIEGLHESLDMLLAVGARYAFVLFSKQDHLSSSSSF